MAHEGWTDEEFDSVEAAQSRISTLARTRKIGLRAEQRAMVKGNENGYYPASSIVRVTRNEARRYLHDAYDFFCRERNCVIRFSYCDTLLVIG